jgi:RNA polymerase sigma factor (sigma-70 family)
LEASALRHSARAPVLSGLSPHLRIQSDERLVALVRRGHHGAFEALVKRYHPRLLAFCRHMLASAEDAEDVLQEVFTSAYGALHSDDRPINARPWLYRIARNRCLNHLRRPRDSGHDSMDVFEREEGATTADTVHRREEFREVVADVGQLPESQRTALLLREIDALSYEQVAEAMETTVPSVKSLLVRARMSLAEASEARLLSCAEVRLQLTQGAEGVAKPSAAARRHVRSCPRCRAFRRELRKTSHLLAAAGPIGPLLAVKKVALVKAGGASSAAAEGAAALGGGVAGVLSAGAGPLLGKAAAGLAAAVLVTAGAAEVRGGGSGRSAADGGAAAPLSSGAAKHEHGSGDARGGDGARPGVLAAERQAPKAGDSRPGDGLAGPAAPASATPVAVAEQEQAPAEEPPPKAVPAEAEAGEPAPRTDTEAEHGGESRTQPESGSRPEEDGRPALLGPQPSAGEGAAPEPEDARHEPRPDGASGSRAAPSGEQPAARGS